MNIETLNRRRVAVWERISSHSAVGGIITTHTLQHFYGQGFYVILPVIYTSMGLTPIAAGLVGTVRQVSSGLTSMLGGFLIDRIQNRRALVLYLSPLVMGLGYLLAGLSPTYFLILLSVALAGGAASLWHPAALSLLSQRYPGRRGFMLALHRSTGNFGDTIGPIIVGTLLLAIFWKHILSGAFPIALILVFMLWVVLHRASDLQQVMSEKEKKRSLGEQVGALKELARNREFITLLLVSGIAGLGQGSMMLWLPLYLQETQGMGSLGIGIHMGLLSGVGIASGPLIGLLSDRLGRKQVIFVVLVVKTSFATLMALTGQGIILTILVGFMGGVMFAVNPLVQAGSLDIAEGKKLEGSMIGLLWGNNALFTGLSPVVAGFLISSLGYGILFWYIAASSAMAGIMAFVLLTMSKRTLNVVRV